MNTATITTLIASITALIGAVSGLIITIQHIRGHDPVPPANPAGPPVTPPAARPTDRGPTL